MGSYYVGASIGAAAMAGVTLAVIFGVNGLIAGALGAVFVCLFGAVFNES